MRGGKPLRVAIDARYWRSAIQTGVERYVLLLLEALGSTPPGTTEVALVMMRSEVPRLGLRGGRKLQVRVLSVSDRGDRTLLRALDSFAPAVVHFPFELPGQLAYPSVFTLHDAGRYLYPHLMVRKVRDFQNDRLRAFLKNPLLRAIITVSETSRVDIAGVLSELACPLLVVPNFVPRRLRQDLTAAHHTPLQLQPYLLAVGVYMPTKNIPRLCRAFHIARATAPQTVPKSLLLVGRRGWERGLPTRHNATIRVLGHVTDYRLARLYSSASAFLFPSLYEGFGIPAQEALAAGCRVLCSDIPVFREITGGLALFANASNDELLADGIVGVCASSPPSRSSVQSLLDGYSPTIAGTALLNAYRIAARV